jgi:hypothetical protein
LPAPANITLFTICKPRRIDSICHKVGSRPFTVRALPGPPADSSADARATVAGRSDFGLCGVAILGQSSAVP